MSREIFNFVQRPKLKRSVMDMSYQNCFTLRFGELYPCYWEEIIPGDFWKGTAAPFVRMDPLTAPIMGQLDVNMYYFYVPFNIIWDDFEKFITGGKDGTATPIVPCIGSRLNYEFNDSNLNTLADAFRQFRTDYVKNAQGKFQLTMNGPTSSWLLSRAYWKIIDDYFRDQNLMESLFDDSQEHYISLGSGDITTLDGFSWIIQGINLQTPFMQAWKKDLFTSALPFAQRGAPVTIPIGNGEEVKFSAGDGQLGIFTIDGGTESIGSISKLNLKTDAAPGVQGRLVTSDSVRSFNINDLREASAIQRFLEFNAIGGSRYKEQVAMHFGVNVKDYRLNRAEFLCGMKTPILVSQVLQNSQTNSDSVLGTQAGYGIASGVMKPRKFMAEEHGCVIGLMSITPKSQYSQGVARFNLKHDKFDFFFPYFENLGEQAIYNAEIYAQGNADDLKEFGYGPRYYEYKHRENEVHGQFKNQLAYWTPQRLFQSLPGLNADFISVNPDKEASLNNIFAVQDSGLHQFQCVVQNSVRMNREMSKYSRFRLF